MRVVCVWVRWKVGVDEVCEVIRSEERRGILGDV